MNPKTQIVPRLFCGLAIVSGGAVPAQENALHTVTATRQGADLVVRLALRAAAPAPFGFSTANPPRIALDFDATANATGMKALEIGVGDLRSVSLAQTDERLRLVLNLTRPLPYSTALDGNAVVVTLNGSARDAPSTPTWTPTAASTSAPAPAQMPAGAQTRKGAQPHTAAGGTQTATQAETLERGAGHAPLRAIDFRRGASGGGRVVVELPDRQTVPDVRRQGQTLTIDFPNTGLPEPLRRRLDVSDFGTPVAQIVTVRRGDGARMSIEAAGVWEHHVYQIGTQLLVDIAPLPDAPDRLAPGPKSYRGDKLSLRFQNVDVRAALRAIADISRLNIVTSDSVTGNLTLHLSEVPWDQALDVILLAKGLDMRQNGSVLWIAPREELLAKEKLELEQRAQIAELEPLRSEIFQLNYQKAEAFRAVFGLEGAAADSKNRVLSRRGSAVIEPRTNQLFVTDSAARLDALRKLIDKVDIPSRQVLIEARIVEANDSFSRNLGARLGFADLRGQRGAAAGYPIRGNARAAISGNLTGAGEASGQLAPGADAFANTQFVNLPAAGINGVAPGSLAISLFSAVANRFLNLELSALEADGKGKIVSSPRVVTADKTLALIEQGVELPYQVATSSGATSIAFRKANLRLEVTPQITPDGNVVLEVDVNKDSVGQHTASGLAIDTKHVKTQVMVENGGTVALGGIYQQSEGGGVNKIPLLGDIPWLGHLFRNTARSHERTELLVFITPKIVAERPPAR